MRCYICNARSFGGSSDWEELAEDAPVRRVLVGQDNRPVCTECRRASKEATNDSWLRKFKPILTTDPVGRLEEAVDELFKRIPKLFVGPVCPLDMVHTSCSCTNTTGCKALKRKEKIS